MTATIHLGAAEVRAKWDNDLKRVMVTVQPLNGSSVSNWVTREELERWVRGACGGEG